MKKGEKYENHYLSEVIFRIDFSNILRLSGTKKEAAEDFRKQIFERFPNVTISPNQEIQIDINNDTGEPRITQAGDLLWVFKNKDENKVVELKSTNLILDYKRGAYNHFRDFLDDILYLLNALETYNPIELKFLGLRYINQIDGKSLSELEECINPIYFDKHIMDLEEDEKFIQTLTRQSIEKENYLINFQYGLFNPAFPNPNFDKDFIIDIDCVNKNIPPFDGLADELKHMNHIIWNKFESAITDKLDKEMKG